MIDRRAVARELAAVGAAFGPPSAAPLSLRWGLLFSLLDGVGDGEYATGIEMVYEGYLLHYRRGRVHPAAGDKTESALLEGDLYYAHGLRVIVAHGGADAAALLARLMSACSCLRSMEAPFAADDALWAYATGGLAALRRGAPAAVVERLFDEADAALAAGRVADMLPLSGAAVGRLGLSDAAPLAQAVAEVAGTAAREV